MKLCEVKDCGKKAEKCFEMMDNEETLYICYDCYSHLTNLKTEIELMTLEQKIERLRSISTVEQFEETLINLGELPLTYRKGKNEPN